MEERKRLSLPVFCPDEEDEWILIIPGVLSVREKSRRRSDILKTETFI